MQCTLSWRYPLFDRFQKLTSRSLTLCVQCSLCLGSGWLLFLCEMQRLQNPFFMVKIIRLPPVPKACGNTLVPEGSISLFSKGTVWKIAGVFQGAQYSESLSWPWWKDLMYLRLHQSEKELDQSLYKLRSMQLVVLQNPEQLGLTLLQLQDVAWQELLHNAQDLGQLGLLSLPRHTQT